MGDFRRMVSNIHLEIVYASDPGLTRSFNEDSIVIDAELGLLVLADGMGGYKSGDVASTMATNFIRDEFKRRLNEEMTQPSSKLDQLSVSSVTLKSVVEKTNRAIYKTAQVDSKYHGMGTTVVLMLFHDDWATIANVGDSRLYRLRQDKFELLTYDHSLLQEQITMGMISLEEAKHSHNRNLVTRALGVEANVEVEVHEIDVLPGDIYLLCSDGLNDMVDDTDIKLVLSELPANLPLAASILIEIANDNGGHDNISVIIAKVNNTKIKPLGFKDKLLGWLSIFKG